MATATAVPTVTKQWADSAYHVIGTVAVGATPLEYATGGLIMSFAIPAVKATRPPKIVLVHGVAGFVYEYIDGADARLGKLIIRAQTNAAAEDAPLGELAVAAIPAAVAADVIKFYAIFEGME